MPDFSVILSNPQIRPLVQQNMLERAFHDALFPRMLFRGEAAPVLWPAGVGDSQVFSAPGLIEPDLTPLPPGVDPEPVSYPTEQWEAQMHQFASTIDTHMPTSMVAIANLFYRNVQQLGLMAGQTLNRIVRDRIYNAALSGWTVADGAQSAVTTLRVKRLNGFTKARNPNLVGGSRVRFDPVSASNPLAIVVFSSGAAASRSVTAFTPDTPGDETGPGTLTLTGGAVTVLDRAYVYAADATFIRRSGGGLKVDDVAGDIPTLADIRNAVAHFRAQNVPAHADARFHVHMDPSSEAFLFSDDELQRLLTTCPDHYMYKQFTIGELLGAIFIQNSECPSVSNVRGAASATFSQADPFAGEAYVNGVSGEQVHRMIFSAQGGVFEYHSDLGNLLTEAGTQGKLAEPSVVNNGIEVYTDRIQLVIRSPQNRLQDMVSVSWKFIGDWPCRTDAATGDASRFKRFLVIEHGEGA